MLWVDKHRPTNLQHLDFHKRLNEALLHLASTGDPPHLLFHGPSGGGKKTRIAAFLRAVFGPGVDKLKLEQRIFRCGQSKRPVDVATVSSNYHIEMNPADAGIYDTQVVQDVIKDIAQCGSLHGMMALPVAPQPRRAAEAGAAPIASQRDNIPAFKFVVLADVDRMTKGAQAALRRTMEKYAANCRLILCCESVSKVIKPVRSRCLLIRVRSPTNADIACTLQSVCSREQLRVPQAFTDSVARKSKRNLRRALLMMQACHTQKHSFRDAVALPVPDWERYITVAANDICQSQTPQQLLAVRAKLYELAANCIPATVIIKSLLHVLLHKVDSALKYEVIHWAAYYEHQLNMGTKEIFHVEAFVARFMSLYKQYLLSFFA